MKYLFIIIFLFTNLFAEEISDDKLDKSIREGINYIVSTNYTKATSLFTKILNDYPNLPVGEIYLAATEITKNDDYGYINKGKNIHNLLNKAIEKSEKIINNNPKQIEGYYYKALSYGYLAYYYALGKDYYQAFTKGLTSLNAFDKCLAMDKNFYDAYVALGSYKYWKSVKMSWVPFVPDERKTGIMLLKKSLNSDCYNKHLASLSLIWIYIEERNYDQAIQLCENFLKYYPDNRIIKYAYARAYQDVNIQKSIDILNDMLSFYVNMENNNHYKEIILKHKLAQLYHEKGNNDKAKQLCREILDTNISNDVREKLKTRLEKVQELYDELN